MKRFDVHWANVLRSLSRWSTLSRSAREQLLTQLKLNGYTPGAHFGAVRDEVVASGIPKYDAQRNRLMIDPAHHELLKVLRAMNRHALFDEPTIPALVRYVDEHFTAQEVNRLGGNALGVAYANVTKPGLAARVASGGWTGDLLAAKTDAQLRVWAEARGEELQDRSAWPTLRDLQMLVEALLAVPEAASLSAWHTALPARKREEFARAVHCGLRTAVLFVAMRAHDLEVVIGVWPEAARELTRPPANAPSQVTPVEEYGAATLMEDMTALLATVVSAPVRLRANDLAVFARTRTEIEARLVPVPLWAAPLFVGANGSRVDRVSAVLQQRDFVEVDVRHANPWLVSTKLGAEWLAMSSHTRLRSLLDPLRKSEARNPGSSYHQPADDDFFAFTLPYFNEPRGIRLREALTTLFLGLGDGFHAVDAFLDFAARGANPFLAMTGDAQSALYREMHIGRSDPRDALRAIWQRAVLRFLCARLTVYGGATVGTLKNGELCFAVTHIGRYLLGATDAFTYGDAGRTDMVVQPNFDVVFLGASPSLEAAVARVAERVGVAPGLAFRLTRASVMRAAESGLTAESVLETLIEGSSKPVPKNVQREVTGWMAAVRRAQLRTIEVIDAEDEATADRIVALLGRSATLLTGTLIELTTATASARAASLKKLRAGGVFLDDQTGRAKSTARKQSRRGSRWA